MGRKVDQHGQDRPAANLQIWFWFCRWPTSADTHLSSNDLTRPIIVLGGRENLQELRQAESRNALVETPHYVRTASSMSAYRSGRYDSCKARTGIVPPSVRISHIGLTA